MLELTVFAKALVIGLAVAAPPGPVAALCISRTLKAGRVQGLIIGSAVASADMLVALTVCLGLGTILEFIDHERFWVQLIGGLLVAIFGVSMVRARPKLVEAALDVSKAARLFAGGFLMTLTNPVTFGAFAAVVGALGITGIEVGRRTALIVAAGVFTGSMVWWTILVGGAGFFRTWLDEVHVRWIHRTLGATLALLGGAAAAHALMAG